jgi:hypothetical protein
MRFVNGRVAWFALLLGVGFQVTAAYLFLDAGRFSSSILLGSRALFAQDGRGAHLLQLASVAALAGFLAVIPLVVYLRNRFQDDIGTAFYTFAGAMFVAIGGAAAAVMATIAAPLLLYYPNDYKGTIGASFDTVYPFVLGTWQTVDPLLAGLWLVPLGFAARRRGANLLAASLILGGLAGIAAALVRILGFGQVVEGSAL